MTNLEAYTEMLNNMVDINFVFDVAKANKINEVVNSVSIDMKNYIEAIANLGLAKVRVDKGRKWKGEGWLVGCFESSFSTGYRNIYTKQAKIYDPATNRIETLPLHNVTIVDTSNILEAYKNEIVKRINNTSISELSISRYVEIMPILISSLSALGIDILKSIDNGLNDKKIEFSYWARSSEFLNTEINLENAVDEIEEAKKSKRNAFKEKKMTELIEWVKNNTDKKGDDIIKLAEGIFRKKYE